MWGELRWVNCRSLSWGRIQRWHLLPSSGPKEVKLIPPPPPLPRAGKKQGGGRCIGQASGREHQVSWWRSTLIAGGGLTWEGYLHSSHQLRPRPPATRTVPPTPYRFPWQQQLRLLIPHVLEEIIPVSRFSSGQSPRPVSPSTVMDSEMGAVRDADSCASNLVRVSQEKPGRNGHLSGFQFLTNTNQAAKHILIIDFWGHMFLLL